MSAHLDLDGRQTALIAATWIRHALRNGSAILALVLTMGVGLVVADLVLQPITLLADSGLARSPEEALAMTSEMNRTGITWLLGGEVLPERKRESSHDMFDPFAFETEKTPVPTARETRIQAWVEYLVSDRPSIVSFLFLIFLVIVPTLAVAGGFNLLSGDIASRSLRFQLFRTTRTSLFVGRVIGGYASMSISLLVLLATIAVYVGANVPTYDLATCITWGAWGWLALSVAAMPYLILSAGLSGLLSAPWIAFAVGVLSFGGVKLVALAGRSVWKSLEWVEWALPWGVQNYLFHPDWSHRLGALAGCLGYSAVFLVVGLAIFRRRDL